MRFDIITLFPDLVETVLSESIIGRARARGCFVLRVHNLRDHTADKWRRVDGAPAGGGRGMLMAAPPIYNCYKQIVESQSESQNVSRRVIYMSPQGTVLTQSKAKELLSYDNLVLLCGHYEGIDERILEEIVDEEISIGDYVLTGGELPACILVDCVARLIDGVLSCAECHEEESISSGLLEYPQYTRPADFHGRPIPSVLSSGDHKAVARWRYDEAVKRTEEKRPDLLANGIPPFEFKRSETYGTMRPCDTDKNNEKQ